MNITTTEIEGVLLLEPEVYEDFRGSFFESYRHDELEDHLGYDIQFVQDNHSHSHKGVLRGLHYQAGASAQAKIVRVVKGSAQDVIVDLRPESATYGKHITILLSDQNRKMLFLPRGMAHGFLALENDTVFLYKCDNYYDPAAERGIRFDDPTLGIRWEIPVEDITFSDRDAQLPFLKPTAS